MTPSSETFSLTTILPILALLSFGAPRLTPHAGAVGDWRGPRTKQRSWLPPNQARQGGREGGIRLSGATRRLMRPARSAAARKLPSLPVRPALFRRSRWRRQLRFGSSGSWVAKYVGSTFVGGEL